MRAHPMWSILTNRRRQRGLAALLGLILVACTGPASASESISTPTVGTAAAIPARTETPGPDQTPSSTSSVLPSASPSSPTTVGAIIATAPLPTALTAAAAVTGRDGRLYVFGGADSTGDVSSASAFDPTVQHWEALPSMPIARSAASAALLPDGTMLVIGGSSVDANGDEAETSRVDRYDPASGRWSTATALPDGFFGLQEATTWRGLVVALGQVESAGGGTEPRLYVYDPSRNRWSLGPAISDEGAIAPVALGGSLYLVDDARMWRWDEQHRQWVAEAPSVTHPGAAALAGTDGAIYVVNPDMPVSSCTDVHTLVRRYDPQTNGWATVAALPTSRDGSATIGRDDRLYVIGGSDTIVATCGNPQASDLTDEVVAITLSAP